jgi:hypothetical protein
MVHPPIGETEISDEARVRIVLEVGIQIAFIECESAGGFGKV